MSGNRRSVHFDVPESPSPPLLPIETECTLEDSTRKPNWVFRCPACQAVFTHFILLSIHTWSHSPADVKVPPITKKPLPETFDPKPPRCFVCTLKFATKDTLRAHVEKEHPAKPLGSGEYECPFCEVCFDSSIELINHIEIGSHPWKDGDFYPIYSGVLQNHVRNLHRAELEQLIADFNTLSATDDVAALQPRARPVIRKSVLKPVVCNYQCAKCAVRFAHGNQLKAHVELKHKGLMSSLKPSKPLHSCVYCKGKFKSLTSLRKHLDCDHFVKTTPKRIATLPSSCGPENFGDFLLQRKIALDFDNF